VIKDLGLSSCSTSFMSDFYQPPPVTDPLANAEDIMDARLLRLPSGGCVCLLAYWIFSAAIFDADQPNPDMHIFPDHLSILVHFLDGDGGAEPAIKNNKGTAEAIVALGLWLDAEGRILINPDAHLSQPTMAAEDPSSDFMQYLHFLTLVAVFHPGLHVRNAATVLAGHVLHSDPSDKDRLCILYDLLENCTFASLKACAVNWLKEELITAAAIAPLKDLAAKPPKPPLKDGEQAEEEKEQPVFSSPAALEELQYALFPRTVPLRELPVDQVLENYILPNLPYLVQTANFGLFLWSSNRWAHVRPDTMEATVIDRWLKPLLAVIDTALKDAADPPFRLGADPRDAPPLPGDVEVLQDRLRRILDSEIFVARDAAGRA
jgi:hypothetical protein